ncbi:TadE/TadG family type IV pilus assembly protein [Pseudogemmobacter sp. W21_MBD1_M6]|uniref:TadE/TadG family type IV pilus assembly protein n=1 Tax=Pseudogemmobacter sp. W21_MBD1_M6 TaxID=3240271 RepID=UPI003F9E137E
MGIGIPPFRSFAKAEHGAVLVEFAIVLPLMLLFFAITIESARMFWSYQSAIAGVRDASRYLARVAPVDICLTSGGLDSYAAQLKTIVESDIGGNPVLPTLVTINSVTPTVSCINGGYRTDPAPMATVSANMTIVFPFGNLFTLFGSGLTSVTTDVVDQSRIFGQ